MSNFFNWMSKSENTIDLVRHDKRQRQDLDSSNCSSETTPEKVPPPENKRTRSAQLDSNKIRR